MGHGEPQVTVCEALEYRAILDWQNNKMTFLLCCAVILPGPYQDSRSSETKPKQILVLSNKWESDFLG